MTDESWVDLVGYQLEAVHDGATKALLEDPGTARKVAEALTGRSVEDVSDVRRQAQVGRATADIRFRASVDGKQRVVGIETKVDSGMTIGQLDRTAEHGDCVVLLCLGTSAMQTCTVVPLPDETTRWRIVDVEGWSALLATLDLPHLLRPYHTAVLAEASRHLQARAIARGGQSRLSTELRTDDLLDWAWLDETWKALSKPGSVGRFTAHKNISGPIVCWKDSWTPLRGHDGGLYLDLMAAGGRRQVVMKAAGVPSDQRPDLHKAIANMHVRDAMRPRRRGRPSQTFTLLSWDVAGFTASETAAVAMAARDAAKQASTLL